MNIQTLSIVVPTKGCVNECKFCVSRMRENTNLHDNFDCVEIEKRLKYAVMNNVNTCILTGTGEPLQNMPFLQRLRVLLKNMGNPFPNIELQTTGVMLNKSKTIEDEFSDKPKTVYPNLVFLKELGVTTISLSVSNIFDDKRNMEIIDVPEKLRFNLQELINLIKRHGFNVRLSLNMIRDYDLVTPQITLSRCKELGADQVTFRKLYSSNDTSFPQTRWVMENRCLNETIEKIQTFVQGLLFFTFYIIKPYGVYLYTLPFGGKVYSVYGMSVVIDNDCMSKNSNENLKYIILKENSKLYCRWDDQASLIF